MRFSRMVLESKTMTNTAMWISPSGKAVAFESGNHIGMVIQNPSTFGYTTPKIEAVYAKYDETLGTEGKAREEIISDLVKKGWVRLRRYRNYWSATVGTVSKRTKDVLYSWANSILTGVDGLIEKDKYMPVRIVTMSAPFNKEFTVDQIAKDKLYEQGEVFDVSNKFVLVESVTKL